MSGAAVGLPVGRRITDFISLGVIAKTFPIAKVHEVLAETGKASVRHRELPAHVMVYYVIALALYMDYPCREVLRCLLEGLRWLKDSVTPIKPTGKSGISQARTRLGAEVTRRLHDETVKPIAAPATRGAWFKRWRLVSLDGSTLETPDEPELDAAFGRPGVSQGESAYPQIRFVSLVENGTHVLFGTKMAAYAISEIALAKEVLSALVAGMLCLADRNFFGYEMWNLARSTGADLLWRIKRNANLPCEELLPDGSYLSHIYPSDKDRRHETSGVKVRVIDYRLESVADAEPIYRLVTTILDPTLASAEELAALYHERWEIETALGELKTYVRAGKIVLRSKTEELIRQEFFGMLMLHYAIRGLMHEAALRANEDPDRLSFLHAIRVVRRTLPLFGDFPPSAQACAAG
jgi:Insertion element 4 transposase N-terminal/Transposase DDE domain